MTIALSRFGLSDRDFSCTSLQSNVKRLADGFDSGPSNICFVHFCSLAELPNSRKDKWRKFFGKGINTIRGCRFNTVRRTRNLYRKCARAKMDRFLNATVTSCYAKPVLLVDDEYATTDRCSTRESQLRQVLISVIVSGLVLMLPSVNFADSRLAAAANSAMASPVNQVKQAGVVLEKLAGGLRNGRVLDKITTVISGQTTVDPEVIDKEFKAILDGDEDIVENLKDDLLNSVKKNWFTFIDLISNLNPSTFSESAGASLQGLLEGAAERFAAWELSTLVALGERWLILTPLVMIPMAWQMSRYRQEQRNMSQKREEALERLEEANQRQLKVQRELERIELKASLLELISFPVKQQADLDARRISQIVQRLEELNPCAELVVINSVSTGSNESLTHIERPDIDGNWRLSYVSPLSTEDRQSRFPQIPGFEINNVQQQIWHSSPNGAATAGDKQPGSTKLLARNTAQISLGPLGAVEVAVQGDWEDMKDKQAALVSFNTFSIRPLNLFGAEVRQDLPPLTIPVPNSLQQSAEWKIIYLDEELRINKGREENLYIFRKIN